MKMFDLGPFQSWLRAYSILPQPDPHSNSHASGNSTVIDPATTAATTTTSRPVPPPLSFICGVWYSPMYKFIFLRNRKTASSTFLTAVKKFMLDNNLCNMTKGEGQGHPNNCVIRLEPDALLSQGIDLATMWREYTVITSSRNPWARAASGYQFTYDKWKKRDGGCAQPTFLQFCRDPYVMGKLSNLFNCVTEREGVGSRHEGHWNFDFCHVEPASLCMTDEEGRLVVDFVIRYELLEEDMQAAVQIINERRPAGMPPLVLPPTVKWRNKGTTARAHDLNSTDEAAFVYASKFRVCGAPCAEYLADFYRDDLVLFGWDPPEPPPEHVRGHGTLPPGRAPERGQAPLEEKEEGDQPEEDGKEKDQQQQPQEE